MDLIRVIAMILVIIVHTKAHFFTDKVYFPIFALLKVIGTVGVPLFVMLTGYLMFDRNYEDKDYQYQYLMKNVLPLFVAYEVWNVLWNIFRYAHVAENPQKWSAILKAALFMGDTVSALWYLPMSIALYLGMPLLSIAYNKIQAVSYKKVLLTALVLSGTIIPSVAPIIAVFNKKVAIHSVLRMNIFGASVWGESVWMIYLIAGYLISKGIMKRFKSKNIVFAGIILPIVMMYAIEFTKHSVQHYDFILVVILSIAVFELLTRLESYFKEETLFRKSIVKISGFSFGVYMLHIWIGGAIVRCMKYAGLFTPIGMNFSSVTGSMFYIVYIVLVIVFSWFSIILLKQNDFIKRYVLLMK